MPDQSGSGEEILIGFAQALRVAGLAVTSDRAYAFVDAVSRLGMGDRSAVYWAGRGTLCSGPDDFKRYDQTFEAWFRSDPVSYVGHESAPRPVTRAALGGEDGAGDEVGDASVSVLASAQEVLRHRDVAQLTPPERAAVNRMFAGLRVRPPYRRSPRRRPRRRGEIDPARTVRDQLRRAGEPGPLRYRARHVRPRRVVLLLDVSGSMEPYADSLLRLAHRITSAAPRTTEVFTLGTRLTRVTDAMRVPDAERAVLTAGQTVPDWSGGTRLGEVLRAFNDRWGQRGLARGAVVVICSDGWERGDPVLLGEQVERLRRLTHLLVWSNPHRGKTGYAPVQGGIAAVLPHVDAFVAGHSLQTFDELLDLIADS